MTTTTKGSTRNITADRRFCRLLAADFPALPVGTVEAALLGRPQKQAIAVAEWATERTSGPARALLGWARRHPAPGHEEPRGGTTEPLVTAREYRGAARHTTYPRRPVAEIAAGLSRMAG